MRSLLHAATETQVDVWGAAELFRMERVHAYVALRGSRNVSELADVPADKMALYNSRVLKPVHFERRVNHTKWCVLRLPSSAMAQQAGMTTAAFEAFYFDACCLDYAWLRQELEPLRQRMEAARHVRITGPGTELSFSIEGIPVVVCAGERNIPDGEVFTAPVRDSVQGVILFNAPTIYQGNAYDGIRLEFDRGRIVRADCSSGDPERLRRILSTDEGASYVGEWSIGCHPRIRRPMRDILFDEKIAGSFHLTPGNAYDEADNGNRSAIHWDLVQIQTPEYGGGTILIDGQPLRIDGRFVTDDLLELNP
jgi:aminopeptidase